MHEAIEALRAPRAVERAGAGAAVPLSVALIEALEAFGVREAFGVIGGGAATLGKAIADSRVRFIHCRHESGAAFAATELSLAAGRPTVVFTTTGPGVTNAITGLLAARWEGAKVILISAATSAAQRGRRATQETGPATLPQGIHAPGALFHDAVVVESASELAAICQRLAVGLARPEGYVAHLALPIGLQAAPTAPVRAVTISPAPACPSDAAIDDVVARLTSGPAAIWVGYGARGAAAEVRALAEALGAPVMTSPRAKGIFPESHPLWLGVTGVGGHSSVEAWMRRARPDHVLVLGSRLGESTSMWSPGFRPARALLHVDVDAAAFGVAYPEVPTIGVVSDVAQFATRALARVTPAGRPTAVAAPERPRLAPRDGGLIRPQMLMEAIQREVLDATDLPVLAECGNAFIWATHLLRVEQPGRYRISTGFGAMGHMATGVLGAAMARGGAVAVVGDGSMLMMNEVSTAAQYGVHAVWVVLNDGVYNMCDQGLRAMGWTPFHMAFPQVDFAALAESLGALGFRVEREEQLDGALRGALAAPGPVVVDVRIDPAEVAPSVSRVKCLIDQAGASS